eukprot:jgi/Mesen1/10558/ME000843S10071
MTSLQIWTLRQCPCGRISALRDSARPAGPPAAFVYAQNHLKTSSGRQKRASVQLHVATEGYRSRNASMSRTGLFGIGSSAPLPRAPPHRSARAPPAVAPQATPASAAGEGQVACLDASVADLDSDIDEVAQESNDVAPESDDAASEGPQGYYHARRYKYRMLIAYDGTDFTGWQMQNQGTSVQEALEKAMCQVLNVGRTDIGLVAAGRTDAGVHAHGQVAHFTLHEPFPDTCRLHAALNGLMPHSLRVRQLARAPFAFHARYSPAGKTYWYSVQCAPVADPHTRHQVAHVPYALDRRAMRAAARLFEGQHDFSGFANSSEMKRARASAVRRVLRFDLVEEDECEGRFRFEVEGTGFLYKQVRNMVGLLLTIGKGLLPPTAVSQLLACRDREKVALLAPCAPAHGLTLRSIAYPPELLLPPSGEIVSSGVFKAIHPGGALQLAARYESLVGPNKLLSARDICQLESIR